MASDRQLRCEVCGRLRDFRDIALCTVKGIIKEEPVTRNVPHCYDDIACRDQARVMADEFVQKFEARDDE